MNEIHILFAGLIFLFGTLLFLAVFYPPKPFEKKDNPDSAPVVGGLVDGATYRDRKGQLRTVERHGEVSEYPFRCENHFYTEKGYYNKRGIPHHRDLVELVSLPEPGPDLLTDKKKKWLREKFPWAVALAMDATGEAYVYDAIPKKNPVFPEWLASKMKFTHVPGLEGYAGSIGWENSLVHLREQEGASDE